MAQATTGKLVGPNVENLVNSLISECREPARLLELYYWCTEPKLLPVVRGFAALPPGTRAAVEAFLRISEPRSVCAEVDPAGGLRLTCAGEPQMTSDKEADEEQDLKPKERRTVVG